MSALDQATMLLIELRFYGRLFVFFSSFLTVLFLTLIFLKRLNLQSSLFLLLMSRKFYIILTTLVSLLFTFISFRFFFLYYNNYDIIFNSADLLGIQNYSGMIFFELFESDIIFYYFRTFFIFSINKYNVIFILLFSSLYPVICSLILIDNNLYTCKYFFHIHIIFSLSFLLLLTENILVFYFIYEVIVFLAYSVLNLSSNSRGNIEASLYFLG